MARLPVSRTPRARTPARRVRRRLDLSLRNPMDVAGLYATADQAAKIIQRAYRARKQAPRKAAPKRSAVRKLTVPAAHIGRQMGTFGKKGKMPPTVKGVERHIDLSFTSTQTGVNYVGFQYSSSSHDLLRMLAMGLVKDCFIRAGQPIVSWQAKVRSQEHGTGTILRGRLDDIRLIYASTTAAGVITPSATVFDITATTTADALVEAMAVDFRDKANAGSYPMSYELRTHRYGAPEGSDFQVFYTNTTYGQDMVYFKGMSETKIQNITTATDGNDNINAVDANPLIGKVYDFGHGHPKFKLDFVTQLEASDPVNYGQLDRLQEMTVSDNHIQTKYLREGALFSNQLMQAFKQPPNGRYIFDNLTGVKNVSMPPGGFQTIKRSHTVKCSVRRFIMGAISFTSTPGMQIRPPIINKSFMVALEPALRSTNDEEVKLVMNREVYMSLTYRKAKLPQCPIFNDVRASGVLA